MFELPPELWSKIFGYLPEHLASNLYAVNRTFFEHAMHLRYKKLDVTFLKEPMAPLKTIANLRYACLLHLFDPQP